MDNIDRLKQLIIKYHESRAYYHDVKNAYNETECRDEYISPLLECFGWDVQNAKGKLPQYKEVVVERFSNSSERPDYTLTLNGVSKMFVEAKKPSVDITIEFEPAMQTRKYGWNAKHALAILTNFEDLLVYDTTNKPKEGENAVSSLYRRYHFEQYVEKYEEIADLISRDSVYSGHFDEMIKADFQNDTRYTTQIDETFLQQINKWRLEIGEYLYQRKSIYQDISLLNDTVQDFINQIVFIRICEDRKLPLYRKLYETIENRQELQEKLTVVFREADKRYNSGLFRGGNPIFDLNSDIIFEMIESLYYPKTPYLFTIVEPSLLGKIYEAFLAESLVQKDGKICLAQKKEYIYKSVVSTPTEIVKYMVKAVLSPVCEGKTPHELLGIKIADIACGSGIFLEEAYQFLIDYCMGWYEENDRNHLIELESGKRKLPLTEKKDILCKCIYGIDIDVHAVEVSKFSLLLKLIEDETEPSVKNNNPILPDLDANIKHGNSLITSGDLNNRNIETEQLLKIVPFDWDAINDGNKFDVILGNPPYVKTEDMHLISDEIEFEIYKRKYCSAYKQFDKYFLFVEQALRLLKEDGRLSYIIPNKFYKIAAGQELRKLICKSVCSIDDFGDMQLFPDKTIYSSIVTIARRNQESMKYARVDSLVDLWTGKQLETISIRNEQLDKNPWKLSTDIAFLQILEKLNEKAIPLSDVADIFNGIQTSAERPEKFSDKKAVYWFDGSEIKKENEKYIFVEKYGKAYKIEKELLKPYFKPTKAAEKGMETYSLLTTDKQIIFPYDSEGKLISIGKMKSVYTGAYQYLEDCYDRLVPKCLNGGVGRDIADATSDTWYQYGRTQALTAFINTPKLIVRVLSKVPMYAFDDKDMLISSGGTAGYCAVSKLPESAYELEYIQAWLAHPYTEKIFQIQGSDFENGFTARGTFLLKKLPFVALNFEDSRQMDLYTDVVASTRRIYEINDSLRQHTDKSSKNILEKEKNRMINKIENLISKVYQQNF
ncbi:MAG: Eco57I restriction-modification methylase domain-containing protein [Lachnospiraceae bacterium]|nr:Eco57I restriction-modification methylase domain-containing protein [Lachnospiraceae bacterium]